jgi:hypothetical protein
MDDLLKNFGWPGMKPDDVILLYARSEFEPHGRASETFEWIWYLELPTTPHYWKSTVGWVKGKGSHMKFKGRTAKEVVGRAKQFFEEVDNGTPS